MKKYLFFNDYSEGAHPDILKALERTNKTQEMGYGEDFYTIEAKKVIRKAINKDNADIHFVSGGTQTNLVVLESILRPYESVISATSGHINIHEAGAIEGVGHKINTVESNDGKLTVSLIKKIIEAHSDEHMVKPKVVFISQATELGTIYSKAELRDISEFCRKNNLYLYLDGARLGSALTSIQSDLTLEEVAKLVDVFYIGGTKNGALLGETIVILNKNLGQDFRYYLKRRGALLAKGRSISVQFLELFKNNLYFELARHANKMAEKLTDGIKKLGYKFLTESLTNQIFPIFPNKVIKKLEELYGFYIWTKIDETNSAIRLVTSWATDEKAVDEFLNDLAKLK
ncbi:threonine aldolase [Candidatus Gottesmanbacteria bacterium RBG_16_38_7b]|uniref:Threonine aldolase n=1 Tax=Candidatus Gottesmanbacteria bacterium RBG_16_38_7b TaxID=1798372 RepID=A0A1F5YHQ5_9BACT|nr:MAG: threonine aldolase [Candidatus Gottesmanbacteria bacterium RBG_16_38_7b]